MKELRISLSDDMLEALQAGVAAGEAASVEELVEAALDAWLDPGLDDPEMPTREEMLADIAEIDRDLANGGRLLTVEEVRAHLLRGPSER